MRIIILFISFLIFVGCATKQQVALNQEASNFELCAKLSIENKDIVEVLKAQISKTIANDNRIFECGNSINTDAKIDMEFYEYWLSNTTKSVMLLFTLGLARPVAAVEADIKVYYRHSEGIQKIKDKMYKDAWFTSKEEQLKLIAELVHQQIQKIVNANKNINNTQTQMGQLDAPLVM
jgi:uncharacterized protein YcfL